MSSKNYLRSISNRNRDIGFGKITKSVLVFIIMIAVITANASAQQTKPSKKKVKPSRSLNKTIKDRDRDNDNDEKDDDHDDPDARARFEFRKIMDPATHTVPTERLLNAFDQTKQSKQAAQLMKGNPGLFPNATVPLTWQERGPNVSPNGSGRIRAIMVDSADATNKTVWVGGVDGGIWKTTDITSSSPNWTVVNDFMPNLAITAICQDPTNYNIMYCATGEVYTGDAVNGVGVFKSTDHGVTWSLLPSTASYKLCTRILCDGQGNVYLATVFIGSGGLLRSTNGGSTWTQITPVAAPNKTITDLELSSTGRLHLTTGISGGGQSYFYTDNPATATTSSGWNAPVTPFPYSTQRLEIAVSRNVLYAAPINNSGLLTNLYKSTDGGVNWAAISNYPDQSSNQGNYDLTVGINPADSNQCIIGLLKNYKTTNGGSTWSVISSTSLGATNYVHADQQAITWYDGGSKLILACDGGIFYSSDGGATFQDKNSGLRIKQMYSVAIHPNSKNYFVGGTQDNGSYWLNNYGISNAVSVSGGDGGFCAIDQNEPQYQFTAHQYSNYYRSTNGGASFSFVSLPGININGTGVFINPWDYDNNANILYASHLGGSYMRWNDPKTGNTANIITSPALNGEYVTIVKVSPGVANRIYLGTGKVNDTINAGHIVKVDGANGGSPVETVISKPGMPTGYVWLSCINEGTNDQNLVACYSNFGINNIWVTTNGGNTWTTIDGNLPDMPVRWCLFYPGDNTKALIATETGLWQTDSINGANTIWTANPTFPSVRTDMIKYRPGDRTLIAATHGRGLWTARIFPSGCNLPTISAPTVTQISACPASQTGSIAVNATGSGVLEYSLNEGAWQTSNTFSGLAPGSYAIRVRIQSSDTVCYKDYSNNPVIINAAPPTTITISAPTVTQPAPCPAAQTGSIAVNAIGTGALEYRLNGGVWQTSNLFNNLAFGNYNIGVRIQGSTDSACFLNYSANPVIIFSSNLFTASASATPNIVCASNSVQLSAVSPPVLVESIPYSPVAGTGIAISLADDSISGLLPVGFTFAYWGVSYTNFKIASNGYISFNSSESTSYYTSQVIPDPAVPNNCVYLAWGDMNPQNPGGAINYFTTGTAPNRKLVVNYNVSYYNYTNKPVIGQIVLYETTNIIEFHVDTISVPDASYSTVQGIENSTGSAGATIPGRNKALFNANNEGWRFTPKTYSYSWMPGSLTGSSQAVVPSSSTVYTVVISDVGGCSATATASVIVTPQPFTVSASATPAVVCAGDSVNLNATSSTSKTAESIPYAPVAGTGTAVTLANEEVSASLPIGFTFDYEGVLYTTFKIASNGYINFNSFATVTYTTTQVIPDAAVPNNCVYLAWADLNPANPGGSINYFTTGTAPNRKLIVNLNLTYNNNTTKPVIGQILLYETTNIIEFHIDTISVPAIMPTVQGMENSAGTFGVAIPGRNRAVFNANNEGWRFRPATYSYSWLPGSLPGNSQKVFPASSTVYTVVVNNEMGCQVKATASVTVKSAPLAVVTAGGSTTFCSGGNVILNADTGTGLTYQWRKNSVNISGATNSSYTATTGGGYSVVVTNSCGSATSSAKTVTVNALPNVTITAAGSTTFCQGGNVVLNAYVAANRAYQWKKNGADIAGATLSSYTATAGGTYKVTVTNTITGCFKTTGTGIKVTVNANPAATITPQGPTSFCAGGSVVLAANTGTGLTYKWKKGSNFISGATLSNYTATTAGSYRVEVTNSNTCSKLSTVVTVTVACKEGESILSENNFDFSVYPNPNPGVFTIEFSNKPSSPLAIELTDNLGKLLKRFETSEKSFVIKESDLAEGIYFLTARNNDEIVRKKISVVK